MVSIPVSISTNSKGTFGNNNPYSVSGTYGFTITYNTETKTANISPTSGNFALSHNYGGKSDFMYISVNGSLGSVTCN